MRIDYSGKPMMSDTEIKIIDSLIEKYKPKKCLEWGSGNSSIYFPNKHDCIEKWVSIEHNGHYVNYLKDKVSDKVEFMWFDNNGVNENDLYYKGIYNNIKEFDFILIDGIYREKCIDLAVNGMKETAFILLNDSGRKEYQDFIKMYCGIKISEGEISTGDGFYAHRGLTLFKKI
mgnify:CR=1 FL=1